MKITTQAVETRIGKLGLRAVLTSTNILRSNQFPNTIC